MVGYTKMIRCKNINADNEDKKIKLKSLNHFNPTNFITAGGEFCKRSQTCKTASYK